MIDSQVWSISASKKIKHNLKKKKKLEKARETQDWNCIGPHSSSIAMC